ncbi:related to SEC14 -phosphatidylinositol/phosphatidylcholine transfer protein [Melanopsichium pennsylvanicum]|uniref:Related to SEC14 -phosphatidylinositol/phosphatidylcholine transfer protein n=2 Tax=Melanopsichium pennsylvanicum TaxID=63383 RepID=A0AAJ4XPJ5_9BASI|nr:related to SEC14-phosphatidylinositol/phosphatidylcholine transfer protein [Melanopsichium pennsylvanicum 4]SNX86032.1 related to SEC14 -phosphatidylinositol/phosphatidylcholine transfer protein [Melanopsichium pennsylvanicum]
MPPSTESASTTSSVDSEPITPPFRRNATWSASRSKNAATGVATPDKELLTTSAAPKTTPVSLRQRFASFTRSAGKSASSTTSTGASPNPSTPVDECSGKIDKLDLTKGAPAKDALCSPVLRGASLSKSTDDVFSASTFSSVPHRSAQEVNEDTPLQKVLHSLHVKPLQGHPGNLTDAQAKALHDLTVSLKLDGAIGDEPTTYQDTQLLRFLRARSFNVAATRVMYLKAEAWKKEIHLDALVKDFVFSERDQVASHGWCMYFHGTDKLGRPIFIQDLGNMDCTAVFKTTTPERVIQNFAVTLELAVRHRYEACSVSSGRWVDDNFMVVNLAGLGLSTFWSMKAQLQQLLGILDNNFPELSGRVQIINAPYMFSTIWSWVKGWLPLGTVEKIDIAGSDYHQNIWEYVPKQIWPKSLGGECECAQQGGCRNSDRGPWDKRLVRTADQ